MDFPVPYILVIAERLLNSVALYHRRAYDGSFSIGKAVPSRPCEKSLPPL